MPMSIPRMARQAAVAAALAMCLAHGAAHAQLVMEHEGETAVRGFHGAGSAAQRVTRSFQSDAEARAEFERILSAVGLSYIADRIQLRASGMTANAEAGIDNKGRRFIFYNATFMQKLKKKTAEHWSLVSVLAHELGHHVAFHTEVIGNDHKYELEADYFSGFVLRRLGASLEASHAAMQAISPKEATKTHPGLSDRLQVITIGWTDAGTAGAPRGLQERAGAQPESPAAAAPGVGSTQSEIERAWGVVKTSENISVLEAFRKQYGEANALYDQLAANRIEQLKRAEERARVAMLAKEEEERKEAEELTRPGRVFRDCEDKDAAGNFICPEMVVVPAGAFLMGSSEQEIAALTREYGDLFKDESPQRTVTIAKPFTVGKFEVTRDQFEALVKETDFKVADECYLWTGTEWKKQAGSFRKAGFDQNGEHPAVCVSWDDAKAYVDWLAKKTGKPYRLLTEAEWEYAARAVTEAKPQPRYSFGNDEKYLCGHANGADRSAKEKFKDWKTADCTDGHVYTAPAGSFKANAFGLYDLHGNVWEWVEDCWHDSYKDAPEDGTAWTTNCADNSRRVVRGGSWVFNPGNLRSANRNWNSTVNRFNPVGFRVGRTLSP